MDHLHSQSSESAGRLHSRLSTATVHASPSDAIERADLVLLTVSITPFRNWSDPSMIRPEACSSIAAAHWASTFSPGTRRGSFHPIMTIPTEPTPGILDGATIAIDGDDDVRGVLEQMARDVGGRPVRIQRDRVLYHLSCLKGGHQHPGAEAAGIWSQMGFDTERIEALSPMISQAGPISASRGFRPPCREPFSGGMSMRSAPIWP